MDTKELIQKLSKNAGSDESQSRLLLESFVAAIRTCCCNGDEVAIPGFGNFQPEKQKEWVDELNGKRFLMPPSVTVNFRSSIVLRKKLLG